MGHLIQSLAQWRKPLSFLCFPQLWSFSIIFAESFFTHGTLNATLPPPPAPIWSLEWYSPLCALKIPLPQFAAFCCHWLGHKPSLYHWLFNTFQLSGLKAQPGPSHIFHIALTTTSLLSLWFRTHKSSTNRFKRTRPSFFYKPSKIEMSSCWNVHPFCNGQSNTESIRSLLANQWSWSICGHFWERHIRMSIHTASLKLMDLIC